MVGPLQQPIDYFSQLADFDVGKAINEHIVGAQKQAADQAAAQRLAAQQQAADAALQAALTKPSPESYRIALLTNPALKEQITTASSSWNDQQRKTNLEDKSALYTLPPDMAIKRLSARIEADRKAGEDTADDEEMLEMFKTNPQQARAYVGLALAGTLGPDKFAESYSTLTELPSKVAATTANTAKTVAETTEIPRNATAEREYKAAAIQKMEDDAVTAAGRLNLDTEKFKADRDIALQRLDLDLNTLPPAGQAALNGAVNASVSSRQLAGRAASLADQLQQAPNVGGKTGATWAKWYADLTGDASAVVQLRREYQQLRAQQAVKSLPPGPASDKDIQLALKGFPSDTDNRETLVSFLRGMEKLNNVVAEQQDRTAEWLAGNKGSLGPARGGFFVGNTFVQPGTRFDDIEKAARREQARAAAAARVSK